MYGNALAEMKRTSSVSVVGYIQEQVIEELKKEYPKCVRDTDFSLPSVLANINVLTKEQFIIIIDEWDCLFREDKIMKSCKRNILTCLGDCLRGLRQALF